MEKLSVVIIAFNEEKKIADCIRSVAGVAEEVLVVDSLSTDRTVTICESLGARVIHQRFLGYIQQKNFAASQATHPLVLSLDADEVLSDELRASILNVKNHRTHDGYEMNRLNFFCSRPIKTCGLYPNRQLRLWDRNKGEWKGINPHDRFVMKGVASSSLLNGDLLHHSYETKEAFAAQMDRFARISAQELQHRSTPYLLIKLLLSPSVRFIRTYFVQLGLTEGIDGFFICTRTARNVWLKYFLALKLKC